MTGRLAKKIPIFVLAWALMILLCGCNDIRVAENVTQRQANQIVALFNRYGISSVATKGSGGRAQYDVHVKRARYLQAVTILDENDLPGDTESAFTKIIRQRTLIPNTRLIEALRLDYAQGVEIEEKLKTHADISSVRCTVRSHFGGDPEPHASVIIREREIGAVKIDEVMRLVSMMVPGIPEKNISISISHDDQTSKKIITAGAFNEDGKVITVPLTPFLIWKVPEGSSAEIMITLVVFFFIVGVAGGIVGYFVGLTRGSSEEAPEKSEADVAALSFDNSGMNLPEV